MIDQIVWILGRPTKVTSFLRQDATDVPGFSDNTLCVLEYDSAMAFVDIAAVETPPMARRFEVYGTAGSAIMEPFEPPGPIRLCLNEGRGGYPAGSFDGGGRGQAAVRRQPGVIRKGPARRECARPVPGSRTGRPGNDPALHGSDWGVGAANTPSEKPCHSRVLRSM